MTCFAERSGPVTGVPSSLRMTLPCSSYWGTPALRKYLETMMSVATCDQAAGISASFISKTTEPSGLVIREVRVVHSMEPNGSCPACVKTRETVSPVDFLERDARPVRVSSLPAIVVSFFNRCRSCRPVRSGARCLSKYRRALPGASVPVLRWQDARCVTGVANPDQRIGLPPEATFHQCTYMLSISQQFPETRLRRDRRRPVLMIVYAHRMPLHIVANVMVHPTYSGLRLPSIATCHGITTLSALSQRGLRGSQGERRNSPERNG